MPCLNAGASRRCLPPLLGSLAVSLIRGASIAVGAVTPAVLVRHFCRKNQRRRPRGCATAAAARRVALNRRGGILDDETELRRVVVGVVARHEEVLRARRL